MASTGQPVPYDEIGKFFVAQEMGWHIDENELPQEGEFVIAHADYNNRIESIVAYFYENEWWPAWSADFPVDEVFAWMYMPGDDFIFWHNVGSSSPRDFESFVIIDRGNGKPEFGYQTGYGDTFFDVKGEIKIVRDVKRFAELPEFPA